MVNAGVKPVMLKTCIVCGKKFEANPPSIKLCSDACREERRIKCESAWWKANRERIRAKEAAGRELRKSWRRMSNPETP